MEPSQLIETVADTVWDVLSFRSFVSPSLLILTYYLGAIGIPLLAWKIARSAKSHIPDIPVSGMDLPKQSATEWLPTKARLLTMAFVVFLAMELFWRFLFEVMLAYFQMRDYLAAMHAG